MQNSLPIFNNLNAPAIIIAEYPAGEKRLVSDVIIGLFAPREKKLLPLEQKYSGSAIMMAGA